MRSLRVFCLVISILLVVGSFAACAKTAAPKPTGEAITVTITNTSNVYLDELLGDGFDMQVEVLNATDNSLKYDVEQEGEYVSVSDSGRVTLAEGIPEWYTFDVKATSVENNSKSDKANFTVLETRTIMEGEGQIGQIIASVNGDPATSRGISWFTSADIEESDLLLSVHRDMSDAKVYNGECNYFDKYATESDEDLNIAKQRFYNHKVTLTGLQPNTTYYYRVGSQEKKLYSDVCSFKTTGGEDYTANLFITTDVHYGAREDVSSKYYNAALSDAMQRYDTIDMAVDCGDFKSQWKINYRYYYFEEEWVKSMASISPLLRNTTFVPINGNHDNNIDANNGEFDYAFFNHYNVPESPAEINDGQCKGLNYSFDVGAAHIVMLSYTDEKGDITAQQKQWLENELKNTDKQWKFVFSHVGLTDDVKAIVERYGVVIAFSGHEHFYRHSKPMLNGVAQNINAKAGDKNIFVDQVGTTYVTNSTTGGADSWSDPQGMGANDLCAFGLNTVMSQVNGYLETNVNGTVASGWGMYSVLTITPSAVTVSVYVRPSTSVNTPFQLLHTYGFELSNK